MLKIPMDSHNKLLILRRLKFERSAELILRDTLALIAVLFFSCSTDLPLDLADGEAKSILNSPVEVP